MAMVRALGHTWTATGGGGGGAALYYIDQVWPQAVVGCTTHPAGLHPFCGECTVMRALHAHLAPAGGLAALVVVFRVVRRSVHGGAGPCAIERLERVFRLVGCAEPDELALLAGMGADFGRLCDFQLGQLVERGGLETLPRAPPGATARLGMAAVALLPPLLGTLSADLLRPGIGAWAQAGLAPRLGAALAAWEPPHEDHNCAEGSAVELAGGALTFVLPRLVRLVFASECGERTVTLPLHDISRPGPQVHVRCAALDATAPLRALARADPSQAAGARPHRVAVVNARKNAAFSAHSEMRSSALALDRLHPAPTRTPPAPPPSWPAFLRRCVR